MKKILFISFAALALMLGACNTSQNANSTATTDSEKENQEAEMHTSDSDKAYTLTTLNDSIASPRMELTGKVGDVDVTVNFGSPRVKGRTIWGELVKYGSTWRAGANEATTIEVSKDVMINGAGPLPAGKYALFTVPAEDGAWKVVFNSQAEQWGAYNKDDSKDVLSVDATPSMKEEVSEELTYVIEGENVVLMWEKLSLPFAVAAN